MTARDLTALLESLRELPDLGEPVDQLTHALQTAAQALAAGADNALVLAAALHDIGRAAPVAALYPDRPHEAAGAAFVGPFASARTAWLIGAHVDAKRYLVAHQAYAARLSTRSIVTLAEQGGPMAPAEAAAFAGHRWAGDAVALRRWDDAAKQPGAPTPSIADIVACLP